MQKLSLRHLIIAVGHVLLGAACLLWSSQVWAQQTLMVMGDQESNLPAISSELRLFSDSFVSPNFGATTKSDYQFFGAHLKTDPRENNFVDLDISGGLAFGAPLLNYLSISEFYAVQKIKDDQRLVMGRYRFHWSQLDQDWSYGLWEPLFKWNPLATQRQGLSGIFWNIHRPLFQITLFASPLFIPDQGPSYEITDGKFIKGNPWFRTPPEEIKIFGENTQVNYKILTPNEADVVLQTSYGGRLLLGDEEQKGWSALVSYMYKPANQLALAYDGTLSLVDNTGQVKVLPQVFYHSLFGAETQYKHESYRFGISTTYERPSKDTEFEEGWTAPRFSDATFVSATAEYSGKVFTLGLQRLMVDGGEIREEGELANPNRRVLTTRFPFRDATQLNLKMNLKFSKGRSLHSQISYLQGDLDGFSLLRANAQARLSRFWSFFGEMQFVKQDKPVEEVTTELAQYANHDRFMLGVAYVF